MTMRTRWRALRRYLSAIWRPGLLLLITAPSAVIAALDRHTLSGTIVWSSIVDAIWWLLALAALLWLVRDLTRAACQPTRDEESFERLTGLREASRQARASLLEIHSIQWTALTGQRIWAIDTATGSVEDYWLPNSALAVGSLVLVRPNLLGEAVVSSLPPDVVMSAGRHAVQVNQRRAVVLAAQHRQQKRQDCYTAKSVVQAAEELCSTSGSAHRKKNRRNDRLGAG